LNSLALRSGFMRAKHLPFFFLIILGCLTNVSANSVEDELVLQSVEMSRMIFDRSPTIVRTYEADKLYLEPTRVFPTQEGAYLLLDDHQNLYLPIGFVLADSNGYFLPTSYEVLTKKSFKNVCLDCKHEWEGGVFTYRCPRCHSTRIVNVPSR
jgi:hypothetical protein